MYYGDINLGDTIDVKFTTRQSTGAPFTLAGTPSVAAYVGNGTTEITAGITLTTDFDSRTGLNNVRVVATSGNGFAAATNVQLVITAGTVNGVSVVGEVVGGFSIEARSALRPTTAGRTLDVSAGGEAGVDWANVGSPTTALNLSGTSTKALEPTTAGRTLDVSTGGEAGLDWANVGSPTTVVALSGTTVKTATDVETDTADIQTRLPTALTAGGNLKADALAISGDPVAADNLEAALDGTGGVAITADLTGNITGNVSGSVGSVTGSVGSVTGNVGGSVAGSVGSVGTDGITAASIAADAIGASELAADAVAEIAAAVLAGGDIDGYTLEQAQKIQLAAAAGKLSGAATTTVAIRAADDSKARITATVDSSGNRTAVTLDGAG